MQRGSSDYRSFAAAFATSLVCGLNPAHAGTHKNVPGPSYGMSTEQMYDNVSTMQKVVIGVVHAVRLLCPHYESVVQH